MAELHNNIPVLGVVITDGSQPMFNGQKVIGVREATAAVFENNHVVRGVHEVANGATIWNDQPVRGVYIVPDARAVWNDQPVLPVSGLVVVPDAFQRVMIIGASLEVGMYGSSLTTPNTWATQSLNNGLPVYSHSTSGVRTRALIANVTESIAAFPVVGETLFLIHPTGNDVTSSLEYGQRSPAELDALRVDLNDFLDAFGPHLPHVMPILSSFRAYWGRGYGRREIFSAQEKGSKPFNDDVFGPIYRSRLAARWMYPNGADAMQFYDWVRNDFTSILQADGIHMTGNGAERTRAEQMRRLRLWMARTPDAQITPAPVDPPSPVVSTPAAISPASGPVGTVFTLTPATFSGTAPITVSGTLTLGGVDVTDQIVGGQYTSTAAGALVYSSIGTNANGLSFSDANATVAAASAGAAIYVSLFGEAQSLAGLNTVNVRPANGGPGVGPVSLIDVTGAATSVTYQLSRVGGGNLTSNAMQPVTITTGTAAWNGTTIYATEVLDDVWYLPAGQDALHTIRGLVAGASYVMHFVGSRPGSAGRLTYFTQGATVATLTPNNDPPDDISVVFVADAGGVLEFIQSCNTQFSYLAGFSLERQA